MTDLSPKARALIRVTRSECRATAADRSRIAEALREQLGADALPALDGGLRTSVAAGSKIASVAVGACLVGAAAFFAVHRSELPQPSAASHSEPAKPTVPSPAPAPEPLATVVPAAVEPRSPARVTSRETDALDREVRLLARATKALRAGDPSAALNILETHRRKFATGALVEERRAATAQALCLLGRVRAGRAEQAQLPASSPAASRAKEVCDAAERGR